MIFCLSCWLFFLSYNFLACIHCVRYHLLVGFLFVLLYSTICSCVLVVLVSCQYLPSDWLERLLWWLLHVVRRLPPQSTVRRDYLYISFFWFVYVAICFFPALHNAYITIWPIYAESAVKDQQTKPNLQLQPVHPKIWQRNLWWLLMWDFSRMGTLPVTQPVVWKQWENRSYT